MAFEKRWWPWVAIGLVLLLLALFRDIRRVGAHHQVDLRNRVVGARLIADKRLPYFYRWKPGEPVRYYDPQNADAADHVWDTMSTITATPLFLHLMEPLAELQQSHIDWVWLGFEYASWATLLVFLLLLAPTPRSKLAVTAVAIAFLFSSCWMHHIEVGQLYITIPLLAILGYCLLRAKPTVWTGLATGLVVVVMAGIRPNVLLFFLPFLLVARRFSIPFRISMVAAVIVVVGCMAASPFERQLWTQYRVAVSKHIRSHLAGNPFLFSHAARDLPVWEGVDQFHNQPPSALSTRESSNFFLVYHKLFSRFMSLGLLTFFAAASITLLCVYFGWKNYRRRDIPMAQLALFGYCLYMITDMLSPVFRWPYYSVQWLFPVLLVLTGYPSRRRLYYALLFTGLGLLVINFGFTAYQHAAGDYLLLVTLLLLALLPGDSDMRNPLPAGVSPDQSTPRRPQPGFPKRP
ncbi:MAG TPA: glycosyltransferase 87 family protein [Puia sp.]|nr:glycosyltransferase 87 family protein [Puia sp.]